MTIKQLLLILSIILIGLSAASFYADYRANSVGGFCFSSPCIENFTNTFTGGLWTLDNGIKYIALFAAIFGSAIALDNYKLSLKTSSLTSHIGHLTLFQNYIEKESKNILIHDPSNIDTFYWYRVMFPKSKSGNVDISKTYTNFLVKINAEASLSDQSVSNPNSDIKYTFTNSDHQRRIISALSDIGIVLSRQKMSEFFETESKVFRLIDSVNATFSGLENGTNSIPLLNKNRAYL